MTNIDTNQHLNKSELNSEIEANMLNNDLIAVKSSRNKQDE
ncbi:hypothetical protein swp_4431 [Shewanella piezotolerans WP3]|uniref:Uncharacterized protein n=1 Tax=Shewanella piezotolerans (strain WP3 / JCM 13877) TaxID=225849 RepID=B8CTG5_SHEPW|nr:hypothetical protein swp_4431 [Shewanella piezotolerans WP3]